MDQQGQTTCKTCGAGTYQDAVGQAGCKACAKGYYQPNIAERSCLACPQGDYSDQTGQTSCKVCPEGYTAVNAAGNIVTSAGEKCRGACVTTLCENLLSILSLIFCHSFILLRLPKFFTIDPDVTPPIITINGPLTYEIEERLTFTYPNVTATDGSGEKPLLNRLNNVDTSKFFVLISAKIIASSFLVFSEL